MVREDNMTETMSRLSGRAAEKIWVQSYPASVPAEIAPHAHPSLGALFEASCAKYSERLAFTARLAPGFSPKDWSKATASPS
jgi:hypothetical protein